MMITRRSFLASGTMLFTLPAGAEEHAGVFRVGFLIAGGEIASWNLAFTEELEKLGHVIGKNLSVEKVNAGGEAKRLPELAAELLARRPDVVLVQSTASLMAVANQHSTIPVVFVIGVDPIDLGVVQSRARPGGAFTGLFNNGAEHLAKNVQLMRDLLPQARRIAFLVDANFPPAVNRSYRETMTATAGQQGFEPKFFEVKTGEDLPLAFAQMGEFKAEGLVTIGGPVWGKSRLSIIELARSYRLPAIYAWRVDPADGGLMSYGSDMEGQFRRAANYIDKILRGANPAELPVEQATHFKLVINVKTASELGLEIPPLLLTSATEMIE